MQLIFLSGEGIARKFDLSHVRTAVSGLLTSVLFVSCQSVEEPPIEAPSNETQNITVRALNEAEVYRPTIEENQQRVIADLLYEGLQALDDDRLMTPLDSNAYARFRRVLALQPDNAVALEGMETIVVRYIALARQATRRGLFEEAVTMLDRASFIDDTFPDLAVATAELERERQTNDVFFELDGRQVSNRADELKARLQGIAVQARELGAFVSITAPSDELGRWIFVSMRESLPGYRLRGNIEISGRSTIRLRLPES